MRVSAKSIKNETSETVDRRSGLPLETATPSSISPADWSPGPTRRPSTAKEER